MRQIYVQSWFRPGYARLMKYISNIAHMSQEDQRVIGWRLKVIEFFETYGEAATKTAFGKSRSTVYLWQQKVASCGGYLSALKPGSKAPKTHAKRVRRREIDDFICQYRAKHPGVDKTTIKPYIAVNIIKTDSLKLSELNNISTVLNEYKINK